MKVVMADLKQTFEKVRNFVRRDLWDPEFYQQSLGRRLLVQPGQVVTLVARDFFADRCLLRASALTYASVLAIVPLLALMFALLKGFGVQNQLEPLILEHIAVGSDQIVSQIVAYIDNTNVGRLGMVGLATLLLTVLALLSNIEKSFNAVWGVEETRSLFRRFADYFSVVTIGPLLILAAISMTSSLQSTALVEALKNYSYVGDLVLFLFKILPFVGMWIAFTALYIFMPNTRVRLSAAFIGGIIGGSLWQLAQFGYVHFQVGVSKYNAIYGTMAALPIFMIWIYLSWLIVLLGLEVSYALQNLGTLRQQIRETSFNQVGHEKVALAVVLLAAKLFHRGERPWGLEQIVSYLQYPPRLVRSEVFRLKNMGILNQVSEDGDGEYSYQLGRSPQTLPMCELLRSLRHDGPEVVGDEGVEEQRIVRDLQERLEAAERDALEGLSLQDLAARLLHLLQEADAGSRGDQGA
ncbi:MAG: YhjD/YihY/BrkB family envelope integrity protein [Geoalkalibacter sp.]|uniref:YhjD/YihY/BrkB family envelope integrity protein n=1 Tax=Geoalkalibacter sp. TaxID=3041440 RepID=UPI003D0C836D